MSEEQVGGEAAVVEQAAETVAEEVVNSPEVEQAVDQVAGQVADAVIEELVPEQSVTEEVPAGEVIPETSEVEHYFEGVKVERVLEVLSDGVRYCQMADGTTKHVPAEIFN